MIVCKICDRNINSYIGFTTHLRTHSLKPKEYYDKYIKSDGEGICLCGKHTKFVNIREGYKKYCSNKCSWSDDNFIEKRKRTLIEKYGVDNVFKSDEIKKKIKDVCLEKYGVEHGMKSDVNKQKMLNTREKKYGSKSYHNIEKMKKTCLEKYGVDNVLKSDKFRNVGSDSRTKLSIERIEELGYQVLGVVNKCNNSNTYRLRCGNKHIFEIDNKLIYTRLKYGLEICTKCNPLGISKVSNVQKNIAEFIAKNIDSEIYLGVRDQISNELDIYIPDLKLAFEYNGVYWHSDEFKPRSYHSDKVKECKEKGIRLFHIFECDWTLKRHIVESMILNLIGKTKNKIYARKCEVKVVTDKKLIRKFLDYNHLQGYTYSKLNLGLYYDDELVSMMSFHNSKFNKKYDWELSRFCNVLNTNVIGGASKLFSYFINNYEYKNIVSYSDNSWSNGNLYNVLKFSKVSESKPSYFYVDKSSFEIVNRFNLRKERLKQMGYCIENKTEFEIVDEINKYYRIWDCGKTTFLYERLLE